MHRVEQQGEGAMHKERALDLQSLLRLTGAIFD